MKRWRPPRRAISAAPGLRWRRTGLAGLMSEPGQATSNGKRSIELVIVIGAAAAIIGDNIGFEIGRRGGRALLEKPGRFEGQRRRMLEIGDPFFAKHGAKAVFFGRWLAGLRVWAA